jgi:hypothetical protein
MVGWVDQTTHPTAVRGEGKGVMTVYVDEALISAEVVDERTGRRYRSRWCHLFSSELDPAELHAFAARIGLRREWFQPGKVPGRPGVADPVRDHYDLTAGKRVVAAAAGAVPVGMVEAVEIWRAKRELAGRCPL